MCTPHTYTVHYLYYAHTILSKHIKFEPLDVEYVVSEAFSGEIKPGSIRTKGKEKEEPPGNHKTDFSGTLPLSLSLSSLSLSPSLSGGSPVSHIPFQNWRQ